MMVEEQFKDILLPKDSRQFLEKMQNILDVNPYLIQNQYCRVVELIKDGRTIKERSVKPLLYEFARNKIKDSRLCSEALVTVVKQLNDRNKKIAESYPGHNAYSFKPYDKLLLGEGGAYLKVQPFRLHPLYGVPFIPASVIKGTLRYVWMMERGDDGAVQDGDFNLLFGGVGEGSELTRGHLTFFDIFPDRFTLGLDIQTPHYKEYYEEPQRQPTDDLNPKPILFICLWDSSFQIRVACHKKDTWERNKEKIDSMMGCLLKQYGLGAKTALGYGVM